MNNAVYLRKLGKEPCAPLKYGLWSQGQYYFYHISTMFQTLCNSGLYSTFIFYLFYLSLFRWYFGLNISFISFISSSPGTVYPSTVFLPHTQSVSHRPITMPQPQFQTSIHFHSLPHQDYSLTNWQSLVSNRAVAIYTCLCFTCCMLVLFLLPRDQSHVLLLLSAVQRFYSLNLKIMGPGSSFNLYWLLSFKH